jgi:dTDP-4-dehydrorhamnose reductase
MSSSTPHLIGTGLNGLIGSKLVTDLADDYHFLSLDISDPDQPVDITDYDQIMAACQDTHASALIHLAAYTNVTAAWEQRGDKSGLAYQVNVEGTKNIIKACQQLDLHLIHMSTAYVFDGQKDQMYVEDDPVNPIEWYGRTKAWAEEAIQASDNLTWTILRIDQPFRSDPFPRLDVVHRIIHGLQNDDLYPQFTNHYLGPTFIDDLVNVIQWKIEHQKTGLYLSLIYTLRCR